MMRVRNGDGGASVWNNQVVDGCHSFPDEDQVRVSTEMSLHVLAYNLKRVMKVLGAQNLNDQAFDGLEEAPCFASIEEAATCC